jgi:nucleoside-diphosphate-sugar epimerase
MRRLLVTGASGFIGSHLLDRLPRDCHIIALGRNRPEERAHPDVEWIEHDLARALDDRRMPTGIDAVIHLAQSRDYKEFPERAANIFDVNVRGTMQLLDYARQSGVRQFIFASSGGIYRYSTDAISETGSIQPLSFYLSSKYATEVLMRNYQSFFNIAILRFFFVYGPGQQPHMLVPGFVRRVTSGEPITIEGDPGLWINPIYVSDAARALSATLECGTAGVFNVAGNEVISITELVEQIAITAGRAAEIRHAPAKLDGDLVADTTRMHEVLRVMPQINLRDGLRRTIAPGRPGGTLSGASRS